MDLLGGEDKTQELTTFDRKIIWSHDRDEAIVRFSNERCPNRLFATERVDGFNQGKSVGIFGINQSNIMRANPYYDILHILYSKHEF